MSQRLLIGGIGNIFLGDDAFGVEVVRRLANQKFPPGVQLVDFGIRGIDLTYALLEHYEHAILIDAAPRGGTPGTLYVIEPDLCELDTSGDQAPTLEMHNLDPLRVMRLVKYLGGHLQGVTVVGCEPTTREGEEMEFGLSAPVAAAIERAVALVQRLVAERLEHLQSQVTPCNAIASHNRVVEKQSWQSGCTSWPQLP